MARAQPIEGLDINAPILVNAYLIIETRLGEMLNFEPYIGNEDRVVELHQMRIAAKRLRYSMEIFQPVVVQYTPYGKEFSKATEQIKSLQEHLGVIHDADVLVPSLEEHLARLLKSGYGTNKKGEPRTGANLVDLEGCQGLLTLCLQVRDERADRYRRLLNDWTQYRENRFFENLVSLMKQAAGIAPPMTEEAPV
jgi:CHAD domain-containing protein